jgi:hypothetical protein
LEEAALRGDLKAHAILSHLLRGIPYKKMPKVVELQNNVSFDEVQRVYLEMRKQEVRKRVKEALRGKKEY